MYRILDLDASFNSIVYFLTEQSYKKRMKYSKWMHF